MFLFCRFSNHATVWVFLASLLLRLLFSLKQLLLMAPLSCSHRCPYGMPQQCRQASCKQLVYCCWFSLFIVINSVLLLSLLYCVKQRCWCHCPCSAMLFLFFDRCLPCLIVVRHFLRCCCGHCPHLLCCAVSQCHP